MRVWWFVMIASDSCMVNLVLACVFVVLFSE